MTTTDRRRKFTDDQVQAMRAKYTEFKASPYRKGYGAVARVFHCSLWTVRDVVKGKTRRTA